MFIDNTVYAACRPGGDLTTDGPRFLSAGNQFPADIIIIGLWLNQV